MPKATDTYNIEVLHPEIASEWHPSKNDALSPRNVTPGSGLRVWWRCRKGHQWAAVVRSRTRGSGCPRCYRNGLVKGKPIVGSGLLTEWHPSLNPGLNPRTLTTAYNRRLWWLCRNGHEWEATLRSRLSGKICPHCRQGNIHGSNGKTTGSEDGARWAHDHEASLLKFGDDEEYNSYTDTDFRREKRYRYHIAVITENSRRGEISYAYLKNISAGGLYIETDYPMTEGQKIIVRVKKKITATSPKSFTCRVRWCRELNDDDGNSIGYRVGLKVLEQ